MYRAFCSGGIDQADPDNPIDNNEHCIMAFFRDTMAKVLNNSLVKALVIVIFLAYLAGAGYGVTNLKEGLERRKLSKVDSYSVEFFDREDLYYREFPYRIQVNLIYNVHIITLKLCDALCSQGMCSVGYPVNVCELYFLFQHDSDSDPT